MANRSKTKGNTAERELAKILGVHLSGEFIRVPNSGSFVGGSNNIRQAKLSDTQNKIMKGDIICPDHLPKMVLESKFYADFPFHSLYKDIDIPKLDEWIKQTKECCTENDVWFLAFKINRRGWSMVFNEDIFKSFKINNFCRYKTYIVVDMETFLSTNSEAIKELCKN